MAGGWANSPGGWAPPNHARPCLRHYDVLSPMLYLHTFIFNIITDGVSVLEELISPPDVLSHALIERGYDLDCYTDYNPLSRGQYHIYSLPFVMDRMHIHLNTNFFFESRNVFHY
jgi:hypothetical protein